MSLTDKFSKAQNDDTESAAFYKTPAEVRNLCLAQADGKRLFLNYAYLISGEFSPDDSSITLTFTTHLVSMRGKNLLALFNDLSSQLPRRLTCIEKRYEATLDETAPMITEINIQRVPS